jgi:polyisoprenoid-binding protein YceI
MSTTRITTLALLALIATAVRAQETVRVAIAPTSKLWIEGTSNLHDWSCRTQELNATIQVDASAAGPIAAVLPKALKHLEVNVPAKSLKCGKGAMDNNLYKALNADAVPDIIYTMSSFEPAAGETKDNFALKAVGTLSVSGKEQNVTIEVTATRLPDGTIKATGMVPVKMTDFGIKPPTAIFGRLKTGDDVKVNFELTVGAKPVVAAIGGHDK